MICQTLLTGTGQDGSGHPGGLLSIMPNAIRCSLPELAFRPAQHCELAHIEDESLPSVATRIHMQPLPADGSAGVLDSEGKVTCRWRGVRAQMFSGGTTAGHFPLFTCRAVRSDGIRERTRRWQIEAEALPGSESGG